MNWKQGVLAGVGAGAGLAAWAYSRRSASYDLRGKVVFISGGSRGLGLQIAREFGARGSRVAICARDVEELERARQDLASGGVNVQTFRCDVSSREEVDRTLTEVRARMGDVDILVNNAGLIQVGPVETMTVEDFERAMNVIFWGTLYPTLAVLPGMRERRQGRIVNITSIGGKVSVPHLIPYSCAKFAAVALSEGLRAEMAKDKVKVVTVVPGLMRTGSHVKAEFKGRTTDEYEWFSLGAASPLVSISVENAAKAVVTAAQRGEAEKILSVSANLLALFQGLLPGLTTQILQLVNEYVLPSAAGGTTSSTPGHQAAKGVTSMLFQLATQLGRAAAQRQNETPAPAAHSFTPKSRVKETIWSVWGIPRVAGCGWSVVESHTSVVDRMPTTKFTKLELKVMEALWNRGACSIREIQEAFPEPGRPAYSTVQTIVYRLETKKAVQRIKKISNAHIFQAMVSRKAAQRRLIDDLLSLFGGRTQPVMAHLIESGKLTLDDVKEAEAAIKKLARQESAG